MTWSNEQTRTSTAAHKRWQRAVLRACGGRCQLRRAPDCTGIAVHADHVTPVAEGGAEYEVANGQGACEPCHKTKTLEETARGRARYYGAARRQPEPHPGLQ